MDQGPLVMEEIDAGAELIREFEKFEPVKVALWLKASDDDRRYLYIASDQINDSNLDVAYGEVLRASEKIQSIYLDPFRVKLIGADSPLAKEAMDLLVRFPGARGARFGGRLFGGLSVDDVYIYPSPLPASAS